MCARSVHHFSCSETASKQWAQMAPITHGRAAQVSAFIFNPCDNKSKPSQLGCKKKNLSERNQTVSEGDSHAPCLSSLCRGRLFHFNAEIYSNTEMLTHSCHCSNKLQTGRGGGGGRRTPNLLFPWSHTWMSSDLFLYS